MVSNAAVVDVLLAVGLGLSVLFSGYCLRNRAKRGARPLVVMFVGATLWMAADLIQMYTESVALPAVGVELRLLGPDIAVFGFLLFALEYTGRDRWLRPRVVAALLLKPLATALVLFSPFRGALVTAVPGATMQFGYDFAMTPLFLGYTAYNWGLTLLALGLLAHMMLRATEAYRQQIVLLLLSITIPFAANVGFHVGLYAIDPTSPSFFLTTSLFMIAALRLRLLDALPIARRTVLEEMNDVVLVLEDDGTIINTNAAARETFGTDRLVGQAVTDVLGTDPATRTDGDHDGLAVDVGGTTRYFDVTRSSITDYRDNVLARVLVCRDVTERRRRERALQRREEELELLKSLQSSFLQHHLRNDLNVVQANAEFLADGDDEQYRRIERKTEQLLEWSGKARTIEELVETDAQVVRDLSTSATEAVAGLRESHPHATFHLDLAPEANAVAVPQVDRALWNLLDNAVTHNDADEPVVEVRTGQADGQAWIAISDNGPGLAETEIAAIEDESETSLQHASGFGLWLVYWVARRSDAEVSLSTDDGTTVELRFATPDARAGAVEAIEGPDFVE